MRILVLLACAALFVVNGEALSFTNIASDPAKFPSDVRFYEANLNQMWSDFAAAQPPPPGVPVDRNVDRSSGFYLPTGERRPMTVDTMSGVSVFDFNNDGYDDIFIAQSTNHANMLLRNDFGQGNGVKFTDVGASMTIAEVSLDSSGSCVSDVDNDGWLDLIVLHLQHLPTFYRNNGNGFDAGVTLATNIPRKDAWTSCTFADVNNDGFNDLIVSLGWDTIEVAACVGPITSDAHANVLWMNNQGSSFVDETSARGYGPAGGAGDTFITWSTLAIDYDEDGDIDIFEFNDQCSFISGQVNSRGDIRLHENDGTGHFTEVTVAKGLKAPPFYFNAWMGGCQADFNGDGRLDVFATNFGHMLAEFVFSANPFFNPVPPMFLTPSRVVWGDVDPNDGVSPFIRDPWLRSQGTPMTGFFPVDPTFDPFEYNISSSFGFGCACADLDNDGYTDIAYHGAMIGIGEHTGDNPGVIMKNDGAGGFTFDGALADDIPSQIRGVKGVAVGDFNNDGYPDIVSVSSYVMDDAVRQAAPATSVGIITPNVALSAEKFTPNLEYVRFFELTRNMFGQIRFRYVPPQLPGLLKQGDIAVQMNDGGTNGYIRVSLRGSVSTSTPRDGTGSTLSVTACKMASNQKSCANVAGMATQKQVMTPGGSTLSSHSFTKSFGLGDTATNGADYARVEVQWAGSVKNNFWVANGETKVLPQINCDTSQNVWVSKNAFSSCVDSELNRLKSAGIIAANQKAFLRKGMEGGFDFNNPNCCSGSQSFGVSGASSSGGTTSAVPLAAIVGASVGGALCVIVVSAFVCYKKRQSAFATDSAEMGASVF